MWANVSFGQDFRQVILHWWQGQDSAAVHCREYRAVLAKLPPGLDFKTNAQSQLLPSHCTLKSEVGRYFQIWQTSIALVAALRRLMKSVKRGHLHNCKTHQVWPQPIMPTCALTHSMMMNMVMVYGNDDDHHHYHNAPTPKNLFMVISSNDLTKYVLLEV